MEENKVTELNDLKEIAIGKIKQHIIARLTLKQHIQFSGITLKEREIWY